ncbi:glycerophosphodiester phosphodiesterase family protein [Paenibacillus sp. J2TS4]|uniref:glycerophosphodiester phosphodiesterase n=1 Tax=Paenibacillus sp. J2TS4 TaxID=2807194 RepID=UPI001B1D4454|nr:glycerophosphodiester phosphodiesterase family protein [Paenibacillus sp. J2TS4]GIP35370.1 hypothetical protein J2TS4_45800 [Paenibacillus sp. J2TS4]
MGKRDSNIYWQAHRGGGAYEAPDNTMAANRYAWELGGIPEADVRTTKDGVIICLHDATLERTTTAPDEIKELPASQLTFEEIRQWDAGVRFAEKFKGEKVPSLEELFVEMQGHPERMAYLDLKEVDLRQLGALIDQYDVNRQVIFTHKLQENCKKMKSIAQGVQSMQWIGGSAEKIRETFETALASGFDGLDQVQLHLHNNSEAGGWPYAIDAQFLQYALEKTDQAGIDLEVLPFEIDGLAIEGLLDLGIRWFATDEPAKFLECVNGWKAKQ